MKNWAGDENCLIVQSSIFTGQIIEKCFQFLQLGLTICINAVLFGYWDGHFANSFLPSTLALCDLTHLLQSGPQLALNLHSHCVSPHFKRNISYS